MCKCIICGKENYSTDPSKFPEKFCSYHCYAIWMKFNKEPNCKCVVCGKDMYLKPYLIRRAKHGVVCSEECDRKNRSNFMSGSGNHQFGLKGDKNASFKNEIRKTRTGYYTVSRPDHPFSVDGRVLQHRLIIEENYEKFDSKFFIEIGGKFFLREEYVVHHINRIKTDNRLENLQILTKSEHSSLHRKDGSSGRKSKKKINNSTNNIIIGVSKSGNIGESCDANTEINSEDKKSESSYSIENETEKNINSPRVPDIIEDENICGTIEKEESIEHGDKKLHG